MRRNVSPRESTVRLSVAFVLLPDFTLSTFSAFVDALRIAADEADRSRPVHCQWTILGPQRTPVRSSCGVEITPWEDLDLNKQFDHVIVVGGLLRGQQRLDRRILSFLRTVDARGGSLIGVCTGSFALARAGLMKGYRCCVHWYHLQEFMQQFPDHHAEADVVYLVDGRRITCAGGQSSIDVAVHLVERHCGRDMALKVSSGMVVASARGPRYPTPHPETRWFSRVKSSLVQRTILLMDQQSTWRTGMLAEIASNLGVGAKTIVRSFDKEFGVAPVAFFRALRVARARWELLNTSKAIDRISLDYGFSDASHFTRLFRAHYGETPAAARKKASAQPRANRRLPGDKVAPAGSKLEQMLAEELFSFAAVDWIPEQADPRVRT
jgi:transcriptional regulator GlxA family with amidase domain